MGRRSLLEGIKPDPLIEQEFVRTGKLPNRALSKRT